MAAERGSYRETIQGYRGCVEKERNGLLELKDHLFSVFGESYFGVLPYWKNDTASDCCLWEGIKCDLNSRRVIGLSLNESVFDPSYPLLNLSLLYPFEHLRSLNLSFNLLGGLFDHVEGYKSLGRLRELEILDISLNYLNNSVLPFLPVAASLKTLILRQNNFGGAFPMKELKDLRNLELLDLGENFFNGSLLLGHELADLHKLKALDLSGNKFSGSLERQGICELKTLQELDLSKNKFEGQIPLCLNSLSKLQVLDLSSNQFSGKLPSFYSRLESLEYLSLSGNNFEGLVSLSSITNLSKLEVFKLSSRSNLLRVQIESSWQPKFQLSAFGLSGCNMARVPSFLMHQKNLRQLDLSNNRFSGLFPSWLLDNNTELEVLLLQNNLFTVFQLPRLMHNLHVLDVSTNCLGHQLPENIGRILPNLRHMNLSSNCFQGNIPTSLGEMKRLQFLDVSRNNFSGGLPESILMGCSSLSVLKLSHNKFSGHVFAKSTNLTFLNVLSIDNNHFTGKIGDGLLNSSNLFAVDMSNNSLTGAIPSWIGQLNLYTLLMSNNQLEGTIPLSLYNSSTGLNLLDLSGNMLSGTLPSHFNSQLWILFLHSNRFTGSIPDTLLGNVELLDLRNNRLSGSIPQFMNTQNMSILLLRGNKLEGHIPRELCELSNIRILDLSDNMFNGSIPPCLTNMSLGLRAEATDYMFGAGPELDNGLIRYHKSLFVSDEWSADYMTFWRAEIMFAAKQRYDSYTGGPLGNMLGLDLSKNDLSGEIPVELGNLSGVLALNLSHNSLSGSIPESFSNLKAIESLDLSFNRLSGRIPPQLTQLPSISSFNVSYNNISGVIPQGGQFNTFEQNNYLGNPLLGRTPTDTSCDGLQSEEPDPEREDDDEGAIDMVVFYWSFASGYVTILMGILVLLCFHSPLRRAWFGLVEAFIPSCLKLH